MRQKLKLPRRLKKEVKKVCAINRYADGVPIIPGMKRAFPVLHEGVKRNKNTNQLLDMIQRELDKKENQMFNSYYKSLFTKV